MVLYTDGITEAKDKKGDEFGLDLLQQTLNEFTEKGSKEIVKGLMDSLYAFSGTTEINDDYTVMIAAAFVQDQDLGGAVDRLRVLGVENIPAYVLEVTERFITNSQNVNDIRLLVGLYEGLAGRVTPMMEPYRQLTPGS